MYTINKGINLFFQLLFYPFSGMSPLWGLLWVSVLTAVLALLIYRWFSSQESIRRTKDRMKAHILEMRLFQQDPVLMGRAVHSALRSNLSYLRLNLKPFLFMFIPVVLILIQMEARFGFRPLQPGDSVLVKTFWRSDPSREKDTPVRLVLSDGISIESPSLRVKENREIDWRIHVEKWGEASISLQSSEGTVTLPLEVSDRMVPVSSWNGGKNALDRVFYPAAYPLPSHGNLAVIEIDYPRREMDILGHSVHWVWPFFVITLLAGYLLKGFFRVQF